MDTLTDKHDVLYTAIWLHERGLSVFPLKPRDKKPAIKSWKPFQERLATADELFHWFDGDNNIGVVTGKISGIAVIDCDSEEAAQMVAEKHPTPWVVTTGKGKHFYYKYPDSKVRNKTHVNGFKLDIRGDGGYVVGPNSVHPNGARYIPENGWTGSPEDLPIFPTELLEKPAEPPMAAMEGERSALVERALNYLASIEPPIEGQGSDDKTYRVLCRLMGHGKDDIGLIEEEVLPLLTEWQPHFDKAWWLGKISNAHRYGQNREARQDASLVCMADVKPEPIDWLWEPRIPIGNITMLEGDPGIGKSFITAAIAADVSKGRHGFPQGRVVWFSAEDNPADTVKPRLMAADADCSQIFISDKALTLDGGGITTLHSYVEKHKPQLVIIDPLFAYLSGKTNVNADNEVRETLSALKEIAAEHRTAILCVRHLNKSAKDKAIYRGSGSMGITGAARSVLLAGCNVNDKAQHALVHIKCNVAEKAPTLGYKIEPCTLEGGIETARLVWTEGSKMNAGDILGSEFLQQPAKLSALEDAMEWLREYLKSNTEVTSKSLDEAAKRYGISQRTLVRAKQELGLISEKKGSRWVCRLPGEETCTGISEALPECQEHSR